MTVLPFRFPFINRPQHLSGTAVCVGCKHEWQAVTPIGVHEFDCPSCELPKGVWKYPFGPMEGDEVLTCDCGNEVLTAYRRRGSMWVCCTACGNDLTDPFYS